MTMTELDRPWPPREKPARLRHRRSRRELLIDIALAVVLVPAGSAVIVVETLDGRSGPVARGPFAGLVSSRGVVVGKDGFTKRLASVPGTTARVLEALDNLGDHAVTIASVDTNDIVTRVRWSTYRLVPGGFITGEPEPWHDFPTTIPGSGRIRLEVTVRRPSICDDRRALGASAVELPGLRVLWNSPLERHVDYIDPPADFLRVC